MKKIIRNILIAVLIIGAAIGVVRGSGIFEKSDEEPNKSYVVDKEGHSYLAVVDENGVTYAIVLDEDGNRNAAKFENGVIGEVVGNVNDQISKDDIPTNYAGPVIDNSINADEYKGDIVTEENEPAPSKDNNSPTKKPNQSQSTGVKAYRLKKFNESLAAGCFLIQTTIEDPELGEMPVVMACKNGNTYAEVTMEGMKCRIIYQKRTNKTYMVIDSLRVYMEVTEEFLDGESLDISGEFKNEFSNMDYSNVKAKNVELNGKKLVMESVNHGDHTTNYYFDGEVLVRQDDIKTDGTVESTIYTKFTTQVDDSLFELPKLYLKINLDKLSGMME